MNKSQWRRLAAVTQTGPDTAQGTQETLIDFAEALAEARRRAAAGDPIPQTPITEEMMQDPVYGQFWSRMHAARERVRLLRK